MVSWLAIALWSALTLTFIWRLKVILLNMTALVSRSGRTLWVLPKLNPRPLKQLLIWAVELWLLVFFYSAFGVSVVAHLTASVVAVGLMFILREKDEPNLARAIQLIPMVEVMPPTAFVRMPEPVYQSA